MTSPLRSASRWSRAAWLGIVLAGSPACWGQFSVTVSPLHPAIPAAYLGKPLPKGLSVALAVTCNGGPTSASIYVDRIAQAVSTLAPVQDGAAARHAAQSAKSGNWRVLGLTALEVVLPIGAGVGFGAATSVLTKGLAAAGGVAVITERVKDRKAALERLDLPANWWTPNPTLMASLAAGQCHTMLLALAGPLKQNTVEIAGLSTIPAADQKSFQSSPPTPLILNPALKALGLLSQGAVSYSLRFDSAHPDELILAEAERDKYLDPISPGANFDPLAEVRAALEANPSLETERAWREKIARIGAGQ